MSIKTYTKLSILFLTTLFHSAFSYSAPVEYDFTASVVDGGSVFSAGTALSASFIYDSEVAPIGTDQVPLTPALQPFGLLSLYPSITSFSASIDGSTFGADGALLTIGDSEVGSSTAFDGLFITAGEFDGIGTVGAGFSGLEIGGFSLVSFNLFVIGLQDFFTDQSAPEVLPSMGPFNTGINLVFEDTRGQQQQVSLWEGELTPVSVTEPSTLILMLLAMSGMLFRAYRRIK